MPLAEPTAAPPMKFRTGSPRSARLPAARRLGLRRMAGDLAVDEGGGHGARRGAVGLVGRGERGAKPEAVDHRGERDREAARIGLRHELPQRMAEVGEHPLLIDVLHALEPRRVDHLPPEGEPDAAGARVELLRRERRVDHRLDALARGSRRPEPLGRGAGETRGEAPERRLEQPVLVVEIVGDQPGRDAGPLADQRRAWSRRSPTSASVSMVASISWRRRPSSMSTRFMILPTSPQVRNSLNGQSIAPSPRNATNFSWQDADKRQVTTATFCS